MGCNGRRSFWRVKGSGQRLVRSLSLDYSAAIGPPAADPVSSYARRHFARGPSAASGDDYIAGSLRSSPARSAQSAFAVQLRPRRTDASASGIYSPRSVHAACDTQRFARRPGGGPAVIPSARGACFALGIVLVSGPATIAKLRLQQAEKNAPARLCGSVGGERIANYFFRWVRATLPERASSPFSTSSSL